MNVDWSDPASRVDCTQSIALSVPPWRLSLARGGCIFDAAANFQDQMFSFGKNANLPEGLISSKERRKVAWNAIDG